MEWSAPQPWHPEAVCRSCTRHLKICSGLQLDGQSISTMLINGRSASTLGKVVQGRLLLAIKRIHCACHLVSTNDFTAISVCAGGL